MTVWQQAMMSLEPSRSKHSDLEGQLEASHAEVAHMQQQIAATTAAIATARGSDISQVHYSAPGDPDYSEDSLIRYETLSPLECAETVCRSSSRH